MGRCCSGSSIWIPAYWHTWGAANFLHLCDIAVILACIGVWTNSALLISSQAVSSLLVDAAWILDAGSRLDSRARPVWRRGLSLRRAVPSLGSAAFAVSTSRCRHLAALGAAAYRLRPPRLGAAMRHRSPRVRCRAIHGPGGKYQLRVHRSILPPRVGTSADSRPDQLALHGCRRLFADASPAQAAVSRRPQSRAP